MGVGEGASILYMKPGDLQRLSMLYSKYLESPLRVPWSHDMRSDVLTKKRQLTVHGVISIFV